MHSKAARRANARDGMSESTRSYQTKTTVLACPIITLLLFNSVNKVLEVTASQDFVTMTARLQTNIKKLLLIILVQLAALIAVPAYAEDNPMPVYLFNVIDKPDYQMKWKGLFEGEVGVEKWLAEYLDNGAVEHPVELVEEGGFIFEIYSICEPHNCWGNKFEFVVSKTCPLAFGLMTSFDKVTRQFGVELKLYDGTEPNFVLTQFAELCKAKIEAEMAANNK